MARMNKLLFSLMLCLLLFAFSITGRAQLTFGPGPEGAGSTLDVIVAVVNDDVITRRELDAANWMRPPHGSKPSCGSARCRRLPVQCWSNRCWSG